SEYVSDSDIEFDFNHSVAEAIDSINSSITKAHKEVMSEEIERQGSNQELSTGQQDEEAAVMKKQEARKIARMAYMQQMER
ncbi:hypothetical protein P9W97_27920, partial [Bacillus cereus]|nr:hypothetical protein [Bacillus cereus]